MSPVVPDSSTIALQPSIHPARGDAEHELPESELLGESRRPCPRCSIQARMASSPALERSHWTARAESENTADDLLAIPVPLERAGGCIPEEGLDRGWKSIHWFSQLAMDV